MKSGKILVALVISLILIAAPLRAPRAEDEAPAAPAGAGAGSATTPDKASAQKPGQDPKGQGSDAGDAKGGKGGKGKDHTVKFDEDIVEGMERTRLDSLTTRGVKDDDDSKHLYRKRKHFRIENPQVLRELIFSL